MANTTRSFRHSLAIAAAAGLAAASALGMAAQDGPTTAAGWDRRGAATYLDARMEIWLAAGKPLRTGEATTSCISCHTTLPYAMSRPILRKEMGLETPTSQERRLLGQVIERVDSYADHELLYEFEEAKKVESRGTEAVLNAMVLTTLGGDGSAPTASTRRALGRLWETQREDGAWDWLEFGLEPFETVESVYHGAALAALAIGAGGDAVRRDEPTTMAGIERLRGYLRASHASRSLFNRTWLLLASTRLDGLLTMAEQDALTATLRQRQRQDGGWSLWTLGEWRWSGSGVSFEPPGALDDALLAESDGYATGLVVHALREAGVPTTDPDIARGLKWLRSNQRSIAVDEQAPAAWRAHSLNFDREHGRDKGEAVRRLFMSDMATSFAVLALSGID